MNVRVARHEVTWKLSPKVLATVAPIRKQMGESEYKEDREAFQDYLCGYFSSDNGCTKELGRGISPTGCPTKAGWKCLKVRWSSPGTGKSGGLRLAVTVNCKEKLVNVLRAWNRDENPANEDFEAVFKDPELD